MVAVPAELLNVNSDRLMRHMFSFCIWFLSIIQSTYVCMVGQQHTFTLLLKPDAQRAPSVPPPHRLQQERRRRAVQPAGPGLLPRQQGSRRVQQCRRAGAFGAGSHQSAESNRQWSPQRSRHACSGAEWATGGFNLHLRRDRWRVPMLGQALCEWRTGKWGWHFVLYCCHIIPWSDTFSFIQAG